MPEIKNFDDYMAKARQMWTRNTSSTLAEKTSGTDRVRYDTQTGYFSVLSQDGIIRTLYRPDGDGWTYFLDNTD